MTAENESNSGGGDAAASPPPLRYAVLRHEGIPDPHYDLMIESQPGGWLYTWRCPHNPLAQHVTLAIRLANHRRHSLDYEGPVSGNRGHVTRVAAGVGRVERIRRRTWLWEPGRGDAMYAQYRLAPAGLGGRRRWVIEGQTCAPAPKNRW
jgi:hypothetical protein